MTIAPGLIAHNHHHHFSVRLHMQLDDPRNNLFEVESVSEHARPTTPYGNA